MTELTGAETAIAVGRTLHDLGSHWMMHADIARRAAEAGHQDTLAFYFAGRGGVLGDADADVVVAAFGFFEPSVAKAGWDAGVAVAGARQGARAYGAACVGWGVEHLATFPGTARLIELGERVIAAVDATALPLFAGWRAEPSASGPGRLAQLIHLFREWRGGLHLVAIRAAGLTPLAAILTSDGEQLARFFGWRGELPDWSAVKPLRDVAEETTNRLVAVTYEHALSAAERAEFAALVAALGAYVL